MAHPTAVIIVVGLNRSLIGEHCPHLQTLARNGTVRQLQPVLPAVTCTVQSSMLTGLPPGGPNGHGIVANGYYDHELAQIQFWKQSNHLVGGEKVWETAKKREPTVTCANLFWWFNMYSSVDYSVTPRPIYKADGRKFPDVYTQPSHLRDELQERFGTFPLFNFWGPTTSIKSSQWIADAAHFVYQTHQPTLTLVYLPHLDYALQKLGPNDGNIWTAVSEIDRVAGQLIGTFQERGVRIVVLSEYGIEAVDEAVPINRILREAGALRVRQEQGLELLDAGASDAFAVADHQVAHLYLKDPSTHARFAALCRQISGVEQVLDRQDQARLGLDHRRGGDLILVADPRHWFCYPYWHDDRKAPDFARTVDIHRKPGYDPLELFVNPTMRLPKIQLGWKLIRRRLGFRTLLDVIPLNTKLVHGSHGRVNQDAMHRPIMITAKDYANYPESIPCQSVRDVILSQLFDD